MKKQLFLLVLVFVSFIQSVNAQVPNYVPTNGLVSYWGFNGNANDSSGNAHNGTVNGATLTADRFGNANSAYSFNGSSNSISIPASTAFTQNPISYSFWFNKAGSGNPCSGNEAFQAVFSTGSYSQSRDVVLMQGATHYSGMLRSIPSGCANELTKQTNYALNTWNHIVVTYEANLVKVYLNGVYIGSTTVACTVTTTNTTCYIGASNPSIWACIAYFNGKIDDLAIYNRVLADSEVTTLYNGVTPVVSCSTLSGTLTNGLVAYYPFCGNANDESGNNNNGTVNGATLTADRFGNENSAYSFNGTSNYIFNNNSVNLPTGVSSITISAWVKTNSTYWGRTILDYGGSQSTVTGIGTGTNGGGNINYFYGFGSSSYPQNIIIPNQWVHLIATYDFSTLTSKVYANGVLLSTTNGITMSVTNGTIWIGRGLFRPSNDPYYWLGELDDIAIWNRALSQTEIQQLYTGVLNTNSTTYNKTITIYPNPANDHITIDCGTLTNVIGHSIKIVNTLGQEVFSQPMNTPQFYIPITSWGGKGVYFVNVINAQGHSIEVKKIVVQ